MKPAEREQWILDYLKARSLKVFNVTANREEVRHVFVDVLNADFVDDFADATGAPIKVMFVGAHICRTLGRDLARMYRAGKLERWACGVQDAPSGFPRWVYSYHLPEETR